MFSANQGGGGAIYNAGSVLLTRITVSGNASKANGGGIANMSPRSLTLTSSTVSQNSTPVLGGGFYNESPNTFVLTNVTISGNTSNSGAGMFAIDNVNLLNVTISGNTALAGGGILAANKVKVHVTNVLLADNDGDNCATFSAPNGIILIDNFSLSDDASCNFGGGRDNAVLNLGPLADNGGPTMTHLPGFASAAIDRGAGAGAPATDQRGVARPQGEAVDVGAVEVQPSPQPSPSPAPSIRLYLPALTK